jgi:hypothetical protein
MITIIILDFIKSCHFVLIYERMDLTKANRKENARNGTILSIRLIFTLFD